MAKVKQGEFFEPKMERVTFRIDSGVWEAFQNACRLNGSNASVELRRFIIDFVKKQDK